VQSVKVTVSENTVVEPQAYRNAMSHFAGAVQLVTTNGSAGRRGLTLTACCSVSDNPATVLVCLQKAHEYNRLFIENGVFAINTLSAAHQKLSDAFSGRFQMTQDERFDLAEWQTLTTGAPVLRDALASFDCRIISVQEHSTHYVVFGEVVGVAEKTDEEALIYLNRRYHSLPL
jgi:cob(II)yrinic acid a,c-diamide reductase